GGQVSAWDGGGADDLWSTAANWQSGTAPAAGDLLSFGMTEKAAHTNDLAAGTAFTGIQFTSGAPTHTIAGNAVEPGPSVVNASGQLQILGLPLQLGEDLLLSANGGVDFDGPVSGSHAITKAGTSPVRFLASNSFKGGLNVNQGSVELDGDQSAADGGFTISNLSSSTLVVAPDATAAVAADKEIRLGTQTSTGTGAAVLNVQGALTNSGTLSILRGSTVNVSGDLEQSGPLVVEGVGGYGATLNVNGGGILTLG